MTPDGPISDLVQVGDVELFGALRRIWQERDPVPVDLVERISFALALEDLEVELLEVERSFLVPVGHRGEETVHTVTFTSDSLSVMVNITPCRGQALRIDGWISDGGGQEVELRMKVGSRRDVADGEGRFAFDGIATGLVQLVFPPTDSARRRLPCTVVTPAVRI